MAALLRRHARPGAAPRPAFSRARLAILRPTRPSYRAILSLSRGRLDVPPTPFWGGPAAMTAVAVPAAAKQPEFTITHKNGPGTSVPFRLDICDGGRRATMPTNARARPRAPISQTASEFGEKGTLHVGDSVALGFGCAMRRKREDEDAGRSREEKIICPPGRPIQVFIPLRAKRRRRRPKRSPTSPRSIPTENPLTASPSSTSIRNHRRTRRLSVTWRRPRWAPSYTLSVGTPARRVCG